MIGAVLGRGRRRGAGWRVGVAASLLAASTVVSVVAADSGVASAAPNDFDASFGTAGIVQYSVGGTNAPTGAVATGVAVVPVGLAGAGNIVVSTDGGGAGGQFEVARFTPSGAIDTTFGSSGVLDPFLGQANAVAVVPPGVTGAGNIVAVGDDTASPTACGGEQPVVFIVTPTGTETTTLFPCAAGFFGGVLNAVTIDASGNIAVAGQVLSPTATLETLVAELTPAGGVTFSTATQIGSANSAAEGVGVSPSGADIYTTGYSSKLVGTTTTEYLTTADFSTTTGSLNPGFQSSGVLATVPNGTGDAVTALPHGNIVVAGQASNQSFLAQYSSGGVADTTFKKPPSLGVISEARAVAYQPEGGVLVVAGTVGSGSSQAAVVAQVDSVTGVANALFNGGSALPVPFLSGPSSLAAVAVQPDGKAVAAGDGPVVNAAPEIGLVRVQVPAPRPYSPITPTRVCDTRQGNTTQCNGHTIVANTPLTVQIAGYVNIPASATAVVVNVTTVNPAGPGYLSVYPAGSPAPTASNLNVTTASQIVANLAEVALSGGSIAVLSSVNTDVVVDVEGYTAPAAAGGAGAGLYVPLSSPTRVCDTRFFNPSNLTGTAAQCNGRTIPVNGTLAVQVGGAFGVPANATAVVANLTTVNPTSGGYLTAYPDGSALPNASNLNFSTGQVIPNRVIVPMTNGSVDLHSTAQTDVVFDISGYFTAAGGSGAGYVAEPTPERICDTRPNQSGVLSPQCANKPIGPGGTLTVQVANPAFAVPGSATAAVTNVTAVSPTLSTFLTVYPSAPRPGSSDLNPSQGGIEPNLVVGTLSSTGSINIFNSAGLVDVVVDLAGYYTAPGAGS